MCKLHSFAQNSTADAKLDLTDSKNGTTAKTQFHKTLQKRSNSTEMKKFCSSAQNVVELGNLGSLLIGNISRMARTKAL